MLPVRATGFSGLLGFAWLCLVLPVAAQDVADAGSGPPAILRSIVFYGNNVTQDHILEQEMLIHVGDPVDPVRIESSRQAIMDLGLFISVQADVVEANGDAVLRIYVKEKYYILPVPKLNRDDENNFSFGAELSMDNLAGLNQQLKLRYDVDDSEAVSGGQVVTNLLSYSYPRLFGSPYLLSFDINQVQSPAETLSGPTVTSLYEKEAWVASLQVSRWLNLIGPSRGWQVGGGLVWRKNYYEYRSGLPDSRFQTTRATGVSSLVKFIDVRDYLFSRSGIEYGYNGEYGFPAFGSDSDYKRHGFFYRKYILLDQRPHENIDIQARLGLSSGDIFADETNAYGLGGSRTLRAYRSGDLSGNAFVLLNVQYLRPLFGYYPLRGVVFADIGNTYPSNREFNLGELRWDVGVGLRLRLKAFVKLDLRLDMAYAYDTGNTRVFLGTGEVF